MATTPVFLPEFHGQRSLVAYSPWGHKESDMTEWLSSHAYVKIRQFDNGILKKYDTLSKNPLILMISLDIFFF